MVLGRFLFGLGAESVWIAHKVAIVRWFGEEQIATAFSAIYAVALGGIAINYSLTPILYNSVKSVGFCLFIGFLLLLVALISNICIIYTDKKYMPVEV